MLGDVPDPSPVTDPAPELRRRWTEVASDAGMPGGATDLRDDLTARYSEPHRHYHDVRHLLEVLAAADRLAGSSGASVHTRLAAWFHDAVYEGRAGDDERASASLARRALAEVGVDRALADAVAASVEATASHLIPGDGPPVDADTAVLLDADLAILAAAPGRYDEYAAAIRAEHPDVDDDTFRLGRSQALRTLAERRYLFHTEVGRRTLDAVARANVARELARLSSGADGD